MCHQPPHNLRTGAAASVCANGQARKLNSFSLMSKLGDKFASARLTSEINSSSGSTTAIARETGRGSQRAPSQRSCSSTTTTAAVVSVSNHARLSCGGCLSSSFLETGEIIDYAQKSLTRLNALTFRALQTSTFGTKLLRSLTCGYHGAWLCLLSIQPYRPNFPPYVLGF